MAIVTYIERDGTTHSVKAESGASLMQVAVENLIPGITADCGGAGRCGTCLCYVESPWLEKLEPPSEDEQLMLEGVMVDPQPNGRLTCQIKFRPELDGIRLHLPEQ